MVKGDRFQVTFNVTDSIYRGFIELFNDQNPLHTSIEFARSKGFKNQVMHGNILSGFISYFIGECLPIKNVIIHSESFQFSSPVYLNDELILFAEIVDHFESVNVYKFLFYFENLNQKKVAKGEIQIGLLS